MATWPGLVSDFDSVRAEAYEAVVLKAFGAEPDAALIRDLGRAYAKISEVLVSRALDRTIASGDLTLELISQGAIDRHHACLVWALVYGARTFHIAHRLLRAHPPRAGGFVELGSGLGPFAFRAALEPQVTNITLVDRALPFADLSRTLFQFAGGPSPLLVEADMLRFDVSAHASIGLPYSYREAKIGAVQLRAWLRRMPAPGLIYILEPGTRPHAHGLQALRDEVAGDYHLLGPCAATNRCPRSDSADWCHFTWEIPLGRIGSSVADIASRRWSEVHASWLVWSNAQESTATGPTTDAWRLLEIRPAGRGKIRLHFCTPRGEEVATALVRDKDTLTRLEAMEPGDLVWVDETLTKRLGDGIRLSSESFQVVRSFRSGEVEPSEALPD